MVAVKCIGGIFDHRTVLGQGSDDHWKVLFGDGGDIPHGIQRFHVVANLEHESDRLDYR
jgi:hypothetical protein